MIAAVCWVPRGAAKPIPQSIEPPSAQEIQDLLLRHELEEEDGDEEGEETADIASMYSSFPCFLVLLNFMHFDMLAFLLLECCFCHR